MAQSNKTQTSNQALASEPKSKPEALDQYAIDTRLGNQNLDSEKHSEKVSAYTLKSLENVDPSAISAKVLVLLSKYAKALKEHNGKVIQLSSLDVFKHVHHANQSCKSRLVQKLHRQLMVQVRSNIQLGSMYLLGQKPEIRKNELEIERPGQQVSLDLFVRKSSFNKAISANQPNLIVGDVDLSVSMLS